MKKILAALMAIIIMLSCTIFVFAEVLTKSAAETARNEQVANLYANVLKFDVNNNDAIDPADARLTLRYSAGLEEESADILKMDTDEDGMVTAIDARKILRLSAGLESLVQYMTKEELVDCFNALMNLPRASAEGTNTSSNKYYRTYLNTIKKVGNVTITEDSNKVITKLNDGLNDYAESEADKVDFKDTLKSSLYANTSSYVIDKCSSVSENSAYSNAGYYTAKNYFPEILNSSSEDEHKSSYLTADDIDSISYQTNQTYKFTRYAKKYDTKNEIFVIDTSKIIYEQTVSGLDSITIKLKNDTSPAATHTKKAFLVESEQEITAALNASTEEMDDLKESFKDFGGEFRFDINPSLDKSNGKFKYTSSITIYFNPADGEVVAVCTSKKINYTIKMYMDMLIKMSKADILDLFTVVDARGYVYISNEETDTQEFYFYKNNSNHTNYYYYPTAQ